MSFDFFKYLQSSSSMVFKFEFLRLLSIIVCFFLNLTRKILNNFAFLFSDFILLNQTMYSYILCLVSLVSIIAPESQAQQAAMIKSRYDNQMVTSTTLQWRHAGSNGQLNNLWKEGVIAGQDILGNFIYIFLNLSKLIK